MILSSNHSSPGATSIGALPIAPPLSGRWHLANFPEWIIVAGRILQRASWAYPYDRVVAQYREHRDRNSMHLIVFDDGRYEADHLDEDNPDCGRVVEHFFSDVPLGKFIKDAAPYVAVGVAAYFGLKALSRA